METKICIKCKKPGEFQIKGHSKRTGLPLVSNTCKKCGNEMKRAWSKTESGKRILSLSRSKRKRGEAARNSTKRYGKKVSDHGKILKKIALDYKGGPKCSRCGLEDECLSVFEFHHRDSTEKKIPIATWLRKRPLGSDDISGILSELDKCDVVCSNCHKRIHYGSYEYEIF